MIYCWRCKTRNDLGREDPPDSHYPHIPRSSTRLVAALPSLQPLAERPPASKSRYTYTKQGDPRPLMTHSCTLAGCEDNTSFQKAILFFEPARIALER